MDYKNNFFVSRPTILTKQKTDIETEHSGENSPTFEDDEEGDIIIDNMPTIGKPAPLKAAVEITKPTVASRNIVIANRHTPHHTMPIAPVKKPQTVTGI